MSNEGRFASGLPPGFAHGFAPRDGVPLYPKLWKGCIGAYAPCLGPTGTRLFDWSQYRRHGTLTNATVDTAWKTSWNQWCMNADGTNDYVIATGYPTSMTTVSVSCWTYTPTGTPAFSATLFSLPADSAAGDRGLDMFYSSGLRTAIYVGGSSFFITHALDPSAKWHHVCATFDGNAAVAIAYTNGAMSEYSSSAPSGAITMDGEMNLLRTGATGDYWTDYIDDVRIYDRVLSHDEVKTLALRRGVAYELDPRWSQLEDATTGNRRRRVLLARTP